MKDKFNWKGTTEAVLESGPDNEIAVHSYEKGLPSVLWKGKWTSQTQRGTSDHP